MSQQGKLTTLSTRAEYPITPYVVGPSGQAGYQTIQSAINAANAAGGGSVYIQQGTYAENLTLYDQVNLESYAGEYGNTGIYTNSETICSVNVIGTLLLDTSASTGNTYNSITNIAFTPTLGDVITFYSNQNYNSTLSFTGCTLTVTQASRYVLVCAGFPCVNLLNCTLTEANINTGNLISTPSAPLGKFAKIKANNTSFQINSITPCALNNECDIHVYLTNCFYQAMIDATPAPLGSFTLDALACTFEWNGTSNNPLVNFGSTPGSVILYDSIYVSGSGSFASSTSVSAASSFFINNTYFQDTITLTGNCKDNFIGCIFESGTDPAIVMSSAGNVSFTNCSIASSNNPAITGAGAGTLTLGDITFVNNANVSGTLTLALCPASIFGEVRAGADTGGATGFTSLTKTNSTTISTGVGSVKMSSVNAGTNTAWIKIYVGTTAYWIPAWTTNAP